MSTPLQGKTTTAMGIDLSLTGLRMGPRDPATNIAKVGVKQEIVRPEHSLTSYQARMLKVGQRLVLNS